MTPIGRPLSRASRALHGENGRFLVSALHIAAIVGERFTFKNVSAIVRSFSCAAQVEKSRNGLYSTTKTQVDASQPRETFVEIQVLAGVGVRERTELLPTKTRLGLKTTHCGTRRLRPSRSTLSELEQIINTFILAAVSLQLYSLHASLATRLADCFAAIPGPNSTQKEIFSVGCSPCLLVVMEMQMSGININFAAFLRLSRTNSWIDLWPFSTNLKYSSITGPGEPIS